MLRDPESFTTFLDSLRRFVHERLVPQEKQVAQSDEVPDDVVRDMAEQNLFGYSIPEQ